MAPAQRFGRNQSKGRLAVGFVLAPRFTLTAFAGFADAIRLAADDADRSRQIDCWWEVLGGVSTPVASSCGALIQAPAPLIEPERFDYVVMVGGLLHGGQKVLPGTYSFLRAAARAGVPLIGLCNGSFILARAGLMQGYEVCVSWLHREEFVDEFPDLHVESSRRFVIDRNRMTCAGGTSVVHLATHLIEKHCGRERALKALRILIEEQPLPRSAWQPEAIVTHQARDALVREAMLIMEQNLAEPRSLGALARLLGVSVSQMERRFKADVAISPREYRTQLRLAHAKRMIELTDDTMTQISLACGFGASARLASMFKKHFGLRPLEVRRRARAQRQD